MALILNLETSGNVCSVAVHNGKELLDTLEIHEPQAHAARLADLIKDLLHLTKTDFKQLNAVAISSGPGSYTGLRIGTSIAKGMCYALDIPLIAVNTLDLLAFQFTHTHPEIKNGLLCPMIDARRMEVYCKVYDHLLNTVLPVESKIIDEKSFDELLSMSDMFFFGDGAMKCAAIMKHTRANFVADIFPKAAMLGVIASDKFELNQTENLDQFKPFYLKEFMVKKSSAAH